MSGSADMPAGSKKYPLTRGQIWTKYDSCAKEYAGWAASDALKLKLEKLNTDMPLSELSPLLGRPDGTIGAEVETV